MNRKRLTVLSVAAAIVLAAGLAVGVWISYFTDRGTDFILPSPLPPGLQPHETDPSSPGEGFIPVAVARENVQKLLAAIKRPEEYTQTINCITYWGDRRHETVYRWVKRGTMTRVEATDEGGTQNRIITPDKVYEWSGNTVPYYTLTPEENDAESLSGLPTWEDASSMPPKDILYAESYYQSGDRLLRVRTREAVYVVDYVISLDTGLLVSAVYTEANGDPAFSFTAEPPVLGDPGEGRFILPDGTNAE